MASSAATAPRSTAAAALGVVARGAGAAGAGAQRTAAVAATTVGRAATPVSAAMRAQLGAARAARAVHSSARRAQAEGAGRGGNASAEASAEAGAEAGSGGSGAHVPVVIRAGRTAKTGIKGTAILAIAGLSVTALYYLGRELFPRKLSPNAVFNRASDVIRHNGEISAKLGGEVKTYGMDYGSRREGRRFHIPEYRYEDDGVHYLRIIFNVEGPAGNKARAYAEVTDDSNSNEDFHYLMVQLPSGEVITITDNRTPIKPVEMRQADCVTSLMIMKATVYGRDTDPGTQALKQELGNSWQNLKYVRCDLDPAECRDADVLATPAIIAAGQKLEGFQSLEALEKFVKKHTPKE